MSHITSCEIDHEHHVVDFVSHTWQFHTSCHVSHHMRSIMNILWLISYHVPGSSRYHFECITYGTVFSSSKNKPKNRVLLYTVMFAGAFGIFYERIHTPVLHDASQIACFFGNAEVFSPSMIGYFSKDFFSLLEGLESTHAASATTKGDIYVPTIFSFSFSV